MTAWTDVIGWTLLHFIWEGALIGAVTAAALHACRRASARLRYVIACGGLLTALAAVAGTPIALMGGDGFAPQPSVSVPSDPVATTHHLPPTTYRSAQPQVAGTATARPVPLDGTTIDAALSAFVAFWVTGVLLLTVRLGLGWWRVRRLH